MTALTAADDRLHPPATDHPWWTETSWFSFDQPGEDVSATFYPMFRPNLGVCSLGVAVWDATAHEPWRVPFARTFWHLPAPATTDLTALRLEGFELDCLEPLTRYRVAYREEGLVDVELECTGLRAPHEGGIGRGMGHFDQPCRVVGEVTVRGRTIAVDTLGMRDRTWSPRPEAGRSTGTAYTYGHANADDQFLVLSALDGDVGRLVGGVFTGYLVRDGFHAPLASAERRVVERRDGYPLTIEIDATDTEGRRLEAVGTTRNRLANQANPNQFAWMSMTEWRIAGGPTVVGEDQEVWSPDRLGPRRSG